MDNNYEFVDGRSDMCKLIPSNHENANIAEVYFCFTDEKNKPLQYWRIILTSAILAFSWLYYIW